MRVVELDGLDFKVALRIIRSSDDLFLEDLFLPLCHNNRNQLK